MRVLVVEGDADAARSIELFLGYAGYVVNVAKDGDDAISMVKLYDYDVIMLADLASGGVLERLRNRGVEVPVMVISHNKSVGAVLAAYSEGADDYVTRPFHRDVVLARVNALIRRSRGFARSVLTVGPVSLELDTRKVAVNGQPVHLTGKEYGCLELMCLRKGVAQSKQAFMDHLYGGRDEPEGKIVDVFICKLRHKLAAKNDGDGIVQTIWGHGYVMPDFEALKAAREAAHV